MRVFCPGTDSRRGLDAELALYTRTRTGTGVLLLIALAAAAATGQNSTAARAYTGPGVRWPSGVSSAQDMELVSCPPNTRRRRAAPVGRGLVTESSSPGSPLGLSERGQILPRPQRMRLE